MASIDQRKGFVNHSQPANVAAIEPLKRGNHAMKYEIVDGNKLVVVIDVSPDAIKAATVSKSGKSKVLSTTHGFASILTPAGTVRLSLNAIV